MNVIIFAHDRCAWTLKTSKSTTEMLNVERCWKMLKVKLPAQKPSWKDFPSAAALHNRDVLCAVNILWFFPIFPSFSRFLQVHWSSLLPHSSLFIHCSQWLLVSVALGSLVYVLVGVSSSAKPPWVVSSFDLVSEQGHPWRAVALFQHQLDSVFGEVTFRAAGDWGISISSGEASVCSVFHQPVTLECALMKGVMFQAAPTWLPLPLAESERGAQGFNGT